MKKLTNFFNKNLTHKILPLVALFLLIFNLFFVSKVSANFDIVLVNGNSVSYPDLANISSGTMPECAFYRATPGWYSFFYSTVVGSYFKIYKHNGDYLQVHCYDSNDIEINFNYCGRGTADSFGGWADVGTTNQDGIYYPSFSSGEFWATGTIYNTDGSIFYTTDESKKFTAPSFGENEESINNLTGGYCLIFPR